MAKRRGRPALREGEPTTSVNVRLPASDYDRVYGQARADRISVPELLRRSVVAMETDREDIDRARFMSAVLRKTLAWLNGPAA